MLQRQKKKWSGRWLMLLLLGVAVLLGFAVPGAAPAKAAASTLFISEYVEGSSFNKAVEIYNGTGSTVDLAAGNYTLEVYFNGSATPTTLINLTGSVIFGDVFVLAHTSASAAILALTDQPSSGVSFNGDDAIVLKANGVVIDSIGQVGFDPGSEWGTGDISTADNTLRRNADVCDGDTVVDDVFDPSVQWTGYATNNIDDLGKHLPTCAGDIPPQVISTSPTDGQIRVANNASITINFSEPVTASAGWYSIQCTTSGAVSATESGGPSSFTLTPDSTFADGEQCTVTVDATKVADQDVPVDNLLANYEFSFTVIEILACDTGLTPIYTIQGSGDSTPLAGNEVVTTGIVIGDYQDGAAGADGDFNGFFIQDAAGDANAATSDGIFVFDPNTQIDVSIGQQVVVRGNAAEYFNRTQIDTSGINGLIQDCGETGAITPTLVTLPVSSLAAWEAVEDMLVTVQAASGNLVVTDHYNLGRYGTFYVSPGNRLMQYTEIVAPTDATAYNNYLAQIALRKLGVDDGLDIQNPDPLKYPLPEFTASNTLRGGYTMTSVTGVLDYNFSEYKIQPVMASYPPSFTAANPRTEVPAVAGALRVASMNVLNYFDGPGFPTLRGATTQEELDRQTAKIVNALADMNADVVGLMEIENDAAPGAVGTLVDALNAVVGAGTYSYINTGVVGTDAIRVALIYKPATVTPVGSYAVLDSSVDSTFIDTKNRPSLAQTFEDMNGARFTVVVNHLKSKGSACDDVSDPDTGDGQGNCNLTRTAAAQALLNWLATDPTGSGDRDFLIIGDLNSYSMEDPMMVLYNAGFTELAKAADPSSYSYLFDGQWGSLDHALSSPSLTQQVAGVTDWHINADEPRILDYNVEFKTPNQINLFFSPDQFRSSDHDPVIVGLDLVPEIELVAPTGTIEDGYGDPEFVWNGIGTAVSYKLWVGKAGSATPVFFLQDLPLSYCVDLICTVDPVAISEANRLANGNYVVWVGANRVGAKTVWFGPFNFTLNAPQPVIPTLGTTTETTTFTPTLNWTLEGTAANLSWFEVYVVPSSTPSKPEIRKWVKRGNVCGSVDGTTCSYEVTLARNNTEYQFWMRGWGPGGYTTGGAGNLQQWAGPETFTIVVALPNPPQNIVVDPRQGRPLISWDDDPNATYFQVWLGPNPKGNFKQWFKAVDVCVGGTCAITPAIDWPSTGNPYQVWMRAYGPAGFSTGGSNGWIQAPDLLTLPTLPPEPPSNLGPAADSAPDPTFTWDGMANATWYKFIIEPQDERWSYKKWVLGYDLSQACGDATGTCSWTDPALGADKLPPGIYNVRVFAWGPAGYSALPATIQFAYKQP